MWQRSVLIAAFIAILSAAVFSQSASSTSNSTEPDIDLIEGKVLMVLDGDNIRVKTTAGNTYNVRLQGVDAPENDQEHGPVSRRLLESLVLDKEVSVVVHRLDSQGRYMGTVFYNGQDIGLRVLENGSAWHYKRVSGEQSSSMRARYAAAELKARESRAGLWANAMPVPPWEFRDTDSEATEAPVIETKTTAVEPKPALETKPVAIKPGRVYVLGPRGGCYYVSDSGAKVYVKDKSVCPKP